MSLTMTRLFGRTVLERFPQARKFRLDIFSLFFATFIQPNKHLLTTKVLNKNCCHFSWYYSRPRRKQKQFLCIYFFLWGGGG